MKMDNNIDLIKKYFPNLKDEQIKKFEKLLPLYESWNEQINVISRKDLESFNERHLLHSLGIAKVIVDFVVSRAVTAMPQFLPWVNGKFLKENKNNLKNGILYLKGGDLTEEMKPVKQTVTYFELQKIFDEDFFETKKVVYVKMNN